MKLGELMGLMSCKNGDAMYGKIVPEETREKISKASKELWQNQEYRQGRIEGNLGEKNPFYGKQHSEETRRILSEKAKERYQLYGPNKNLHTRHIVQLTMNGEFIAEYSSIKIASESTGVNKGNISNCCRGWYKSAGGYIWMYKEDWEEIQSAENTDRKN